jgi:hypothetical protein
MNYENRKFYILDVSELDLVDFSQVLETSKKTVRKSADESKTFIKFDGENPEFLENLNSKEGPYTYTEIIEILSGTDWTPELNPEN